MPDLVLVVDPMLDGLESIYDKEEGTRVPSESPMTDCWLDFCLDSGRLEDRLELCVREHVLWDCDNAIGEPAFCCDELTDLELTGADETLDELLDITLDWGDIGFIMDELGLGVADWQLTTDDGGRLTSSSFIELCVQRLYDVLLLEHLLSLWTVCTDSVREGLWFDESTTVGVWPCELLVCERFFSVTSFDWLHSELCDTEELLCLLTADISLFRISPSFMLFPVAVDSITRKPRVIILVVICRFIGFWGFCQVPAKWPQGLFDPLLPCNIMWPLSFAIILVHPLLCDGNYIKSKIVTH